MLVLPVAIGYGCNMVTVHEDGTATDGAGNSLTREQVLRRAGGCGFCGDNIISFESQAAYDNFMAWANGYIGGIQDPDARRNYQTQLGIIQQDVSTHGLVGGDLPTNTQEGSFGSGSSGGSGGGK